MVEPGPAGSDYGNVSGNFYDKYQTRNPIACALMNGFLGAFDELTQVARGRTAFEIGCGEGELSLRLLARGWDVRGCDVEPDVVAEANQRAGDSGFGNRFALRSIYDLAAAEISADLLICCEVLEHLPDPQAALSRLAAQDAQHILLSVPREPIWRVLNCARGKYLKDWGNTPGHLQHWSRRAFLKLVSAHFEVLETRSPLPWTMVLCRKRHG